MLSKNDFTKELGKSIYIYPFYEKNIKDNSINLSIGNYAWALGEGNVTKDKDGNFILVKADQQQNIESAVTGSKSKRNSTKIRYGESAIRNIGGKKYLILLPRVTTAVETKEVIGVNNCIGGNFAFKSWSCCTRYWRYRNYAWAMLLWTSSDFSSQRLR